MRAQGNGELIGTSSAILELVEEIGRIATSDAKVLVTGESGVGKELVASAIHRRSARASRQLVTVNCAGLPETLLESELFGHVKGSFTGAYRDKIGKLDLADKQEPARHDHAGVVPRGPVLPAQRHSPDGAGAARTARGHSAADRTLP